jgi:Trypsin-co-occurring domain 2
MSDGTIPLIDAVQSLREEIRRASQAAEGEDLRFELGTVELELTVVAKRDGEADGKVEFHILGVGASIGASAKIASEHTQKVKLTLMPVQEGKGSRIQIGRRR